MPDEFDNPAVARILIAEDEVIVAQELAMTLTDFGYEVVRQVPTGQLAIQLADELKPDLILMDIRLAGEIDGIQASEQIRSRLDIPIIFLTACEKTDTISRAKMTEPYGFLTKPFSSYVLKTTIETALYKHAADKRVKESEQRYRTLVEQSIDGIALIQGTTVRFVNPACARMFGFESNEKLEEQDFLAFVTPEFRDLMKKRAHEREEGKPVPTSYEFTALRKDGTRFEAELRLSLTTCRGQPAIQAVIRDITERKKAEEALRESQEKLKCISNSVRDAIILVDDRGEISFWNPAAERMFGYIGSEVLGKNVHELLAPRELANAYYAGIREFAETGQGAAVGSTLELQAVHRNGNRFPVELSLSSFQMAGRWHAVGAARDITERKKAEEALRESEERYRELVEMSDDIAYRTDAGGFFSFVNRVASRITGYLEAELIGLHYTDLIPPEYREESEKFYGQQFINKIPATYYEFPIRTKTGEVIWVGQNVQLLTKNEEVVAFQAIARDITRGKTAEEALRKAKEDLETRVLERTAELRKVNEQLQLELTERKRAEEALRESEERYRGVFNNATVGILLVTESGRCLQGNSTIRNMLGYTEEELKMLSVWDITFPDDIQISKENLDALHRGDLDSYRFEKRYVRKDGTLLWADSSVSAIRDTEGQHVATMGVISDITGRKRAEEALKESQQQYRSLFEESVDGVYSVSRNGEITDANPAFLEMFGYTRDEMIGMDINKLYVDPSHCSTCQEELEKNGFIRDYEVKWRKKDGTEIDVTLTLSVYYGKDRGIAGYRGIARDVTERRLLERQLLHAQKMEAVGTLAGGVAHDFNNLLQVVLGYSELILRKKDLPDQLRKDLEKICQAGLDGSDLVQRLLTFSRKTEPKFLQLDLNQRICKIRKFLERIIPKMIDIEIALANDLSTIHADPTQVDQVLMNLAVNARDAMPESGRLVIETENIAIDEDYARLHLELKPGRYVILRVSDTGIGMGQETIEHIFEPFFTTKEAGKGTGLGLAVVHGIVKQHGGHLACHSEVGKGTTFNVFFPAIHGEMETDLEFTGIMPAFGTETVLLVEDEDAIRELGARILTNQGYTVLQASNGGEALDIIWKEHSRISVVILDLIMPEMGGSECLKRLLRFDPNVKVIVASGYTADVSTEEIIQQGAKGVVKKPFRLKELLREVRRVLDDG